MNSLASHLHDLAARCEKTQMPVASSFFSSSDIDTLFKQEREGTLDGVLYRLFGGKEDAERELVLFIPSYLENEESEFICEQYEIIACVEFSPKGEMFATPFSHRDVLGALMHLGIKRETIGDIYILDNKGYVYVTKAGSIEALTIEKIKNCPVKAKQIALKQNFLSIKKEPFSISIPSIRLDVIIAESFHVSREKAQEWIKEGKVHLGFQQRIENATAPKEKEKIYVEGKGKIKFIEVTGTSKKCKIVVAMERYL